MELPDRGKTRSALTLQRTIGAGTIGASALVGATTFVESTAVSELWAGGVGALLALLLFFVGELLLHADPHNGLVIRAVSFIQTAAAAMLSALGTKLALVLFVVGAVVIIFLALYFAVSPATNNGGNPHALSTALEQPLNCEQEDPVITIPSLDYLQSIPPSKARDTLSATSRQFQHYRQFLNCLNEQIEFDKARFRNEAPNTLAATARSSRIHEWNNHYDRMYDRRGLYQQRFRSLIDAWCRIDVETVGCLQEFPT